MDSIVPMRYALLSVSDKQGLVEFAQQLVAHRVEIFSTGGTAQALRAAGIAVQDIAQYTGFPEILDGRVKTLHPKVFGGILARRDAPDHRTTLAEHAIVPWDLVVVNLYPFQETIARQGTTESEAIEKIDVGGPSMIRAAAKNFASVAVATSCGDYCRIADQLQRYQGTTLALRKELATRAFEHTCVYDQAIAEYFRHTMAPAADTPSTMDGDSESATTSFPARIELTLVRKSPPLRYGENPHQSAAAYEFSHATGDGILAATKLHGKELSYNNLLDLDSAWRIVCGLPDCAVSVIKHNNPCGAASAKQLSVAMQNALAGDPVSAFGSILGINSVVDEQTAEVLTAPGLFIEAIVAAGFDPQALEILTTRTKWKQNVRLLVANPGQNLPGHNRLGHGSHWEYRHIQGGMLVQESDDDSDRDGDWKVVTASEPSVTDWPDLKFAWRVVRYVKSNAIVVARDRSLCGAGAGQMSRVDSVEIALRKAGNRAQGAVLASDAFFPFDDSIRHAAQHGIRAIIQPGGSKRDAEVIQTCDELGLTMVFTGRRHFRH